MRQPSVAFTWLLVSALALACGTIPSYPAVSAEARPPSDTTARGKTIFDGKGNCLSCHRVADHGSYMGPDLSAIGEYRKPQELQKALEVPSPKVSPQNRIYRVVGNDGKIITGRLLNQDTNSIQMLTTDARLVSLKKANLRSFDFTDTPPMPSYSDKLTVAERTDLIAYLLSLRGVIRQ